MALRRLALLLLGVAGGATAQTAPPAVTTAIVPDGTLGTSVSSAGSVHTIDGGRQSGGNLFHSFGQFDLATGEVAQWTFSAGEPGAIANVINRVTGGDPSHLYGTLDSTALPNADFFFLNPAGIIFGPEAQLNVPAAAHVSTAGTLRFADGSAFAISTPGGSTLSVASPEGFGFLGNEGAILMAGTNAAFLPEPATVTLSASEIRITNATLSSAGFQLHGAGTAPGTFVPGTLSPGAGAVNLDGSFLVTTSTAGADGSIQVSGGAVRLEGSVLSAFSSPDANSGGIDILADSLALDNASNVITTGLGERSAGDIDVAARAISVTGGAEIASRSSDTGAPGEILLRGEDILLSNGSILSNPFGSGDAGVVELSGTRSVTLEEFSSISTDSNGSGDGGGVFVETPQLRLLDSFISADALGEGDAGGVFVAAGDAELVRSYMTSDAYDTGDGGIVHLAVPGTLTLQDGSYLTSNAYASGDSGGVLIDGGSVVLDRSAVVASASGDGEAFLIAFQLTGLLRLQNGSRIASNTLGRGSAGGVVVSAPKVEIVASQIQSEAYGDGDGGFIGFEVAERMTMEDGAELSSRSLGAGDAGGVGIEAPVLQLGMGTAITSTAEGDGRGGDVRLTVADRLAIDGGRVSAGAEGAGRGGNVAVEAKTIDLAFGSISADSGAFATGDAGDVTVAADTLNMGALSAITSNSGDAGDGGNVDVTVGRLSMASQATITSRSHGAGDGGSVTVRGGTATLVDSWVDSDAFGTGNGGAVTVALDALDMVRSRISSEAVDSGDAGTVAVKVTGALVMRNAEITTNTSGPGSAGDLTIEAGSLRMTERALIGSEATGEATGPSGNLELTAGRLEILDRSTLTTSTVNANPAGNIAVETERLLLSGQGSAISSENLSDEGGPAGNILISAGNATIAEGGRITTNSLQGAAGNILIDMPNSGYLRLIGAGAPGVLETSSGPGTGGLIVIDNPFAIVSHGGDILALGQSGGANVRISSNYFIASADRLNRVEVDGDLQFDNAIYDVSAGTVSPDLSVIDASGILRGQCTAVRSGSRLSQLGIRPIGPYGVRATPEPSADAVAPPGTCQ
ncbi:filamentous hemagglutinin N-terminal domain-containing protein [Sphingomonas parva]|uniref:Filamentous hemagglutinin N-terminal domain-containing protein n=1 Tax=Sphingomonas parva TaxID=2555898 RepID=A0A4Y8ZVJ7_9SPHN|nr:filamentous hemagglutinin N-terminal domain-containing protein [Sphingomonas parva]TFI60048.1 filamentous hemagglutinin N-terminal domain-containing protein [Sphingomonas parva]